MNGSFFRHSLPWLLAALLSCQREAVLPAPEPEEEEQAVTVRRPECLHLFLSEEMADRVESGVPDTRGVTAGDLLKELGAVSVERLFPDAGEYEPRTRKAGLHRWYKAVLRDDVPATRAGEAFSGLPGVELAENVPPATLTGKFDDPYFSRQWALDNPDFGGLDIRCQSVWDEYTVGNPDVIVAVIDGGIDLDHPDLAWNCLEDGHYNYVKNNRTIVPHAHGTHVAGTIGAVSNNATGVAGIAGGDFAAGRRGVSLLSQQVFQTVTDSDGKEYDAGGDFERAIKEAADKGAVICQNSWGYGGDTDGDGTISESELSTIKKIFDDIPHAFQHAVDYFIRYAGCDNEGNQLPDSPMKGGVVIFAAGNESIPYGPPANYEPVIAVGAIVNNGQRASFSNYGDWVDICAPGTDIVSTIPNGKYASFYGTSMACPHVSGVAALVVSRYGGPGFTNEELKARLLGSGNSDIFGAGEVGPMVDAYGAIVFGGIEPPETVAGFTTASNSNYIDCTFPAVTAYGYFAIAGKTEEAVLAADPFHPSEDVVIGRLVFPEETRRGESITVRVEGLEFEADYFVSVRSYNFNRVLSGAAPVAHIHTGVNHPPVIGLEGTDFSFRHYEHVRLPVRLYDPDGHKLDIDFRTDGIGTLEATGSDGDYVFVLDCPIVENTPASFRATIVLKDPYGMSAEKSFTYSVSENHAPVAVKPLENAQIDAPGRQVTFLLTDYFADPDDEPLSFSVLSLDGARLHVSCQDGVMNVTALSSGAGMISITVSDRLGKSLSVRQGILVRPEGETISLEPGTVIDDKLLILTGLSEAESRIRILNPTGGSVYDTVVTCSAFSPVVIRTDALAPGRYTLTVTTGGETVRKTLVKK